MVEQLATIEEIHHKVQLGRRLESIVQLDDEGAIDLLEDISLSLRLDEQVALGDHIFLQLLHGVKVFGAIPSHKVNFAE